MRILIAGCGDIGTRFARRMLSENHEVFAIRRSLPENEPAIHWIQADLNTVKSEALPDAIEACLYCPTPDAREEGAYRAIFIKALGRLISALKEKQLAETPFLFLSSTAVYGQNMGEAVDENSATCPTAFNGKILLEAENLCQQELSNACIIRSAGIYGPGRGRLIRMVKSARERTLSPAWTNRIHSEDLSRFLKHLLQQPTRTAIYNAVDTGPSLNIDVMNWLAEQTDSEKYTADKSDIGGKRVLPTELVNSGFSLNYPDFRLGYQSLLDES